MKKIKIPLPDDERKYFQEQGRPVNQVIIDVPANVGTGVPHMPQAECRICVDVAFGDVTIKANRDGLITLARHLLTLAQEEYDVGTHIHYETDTLLDDGSWSLIVDKTK